MTSYQRRLLPSASMLAAFDAAARTGSFTAAGKELSLTQGAISRQISALENQLGVVFFERIRKTVRLTDAGRLYASEIHRALQIIRTASLGAMTSPLNGALNLAILPTIGTRWLIPRMPQFLAAHPEITVNFVTRLSPFDLQADGVHAAIHYGPANWPGAECTFLMSEQVVPVCAPSLISGDRQPGPLELAKMPLLTLATRAEAWSNWFLANGVEPPEERGMRFEQFSFIARAAVAGLGAALLPKFLIRSELERGELIVVSDFSVQSDSNYYLVSPIERSHYAPVVAFRTWLLEAIAAWQA
jgi:LysR family glycine cleavage system transcriptional activator